ncbi:hypothetical protein [Legionella sp. WA2022007384]
MKKLILAVFILSSNVGFSATDMNTNWNCTTNASSSDVAADKAADDQMANKQGPVADSFAFAAKNCRDCTKITCEQK